jgi:predicted Fe-Mo cluster-binding NifX family protein
VVVCVPVTVNGLIDPRWGRANRVAIAEVTEQGIAGWQEFDVGWNTLHDAGSEGSHHARIARFLLDNRVEAVVANHMGVPMANMLDRMGLKVRLGALGDAREAATAAIDREPS